MTGQRANLIVVENGDYELYYDHWCASCLERLVFWGEEFSVRFFRAHNEDKQVWLDTVWCEGGAVIDRERKQLLFFGGESEVYSNLQCRTIYMDLLQYMWKGYSVKWAYNEIVDLAGHVGISREKVIDPTTLEYSDDDLIIAYTFACRDEDVVEGICTVRMLDGNMLVLPMSDLAGGHDVLFCGERLVESLEKFPSRKPESINYSSGFPLHGMHIDFVSKELGFWWAAHPLYIPERLQPFWPGWRIHLWEGNYMNHLQAAGGALIFPKMDTLKCIDIIEKVVCGECRNTSDIFTTIAAFGNNGYSVDEEPFISEVQQCVFDDDYRKNEFRRVAKRYITEMGIG